MAPTGDAAAAQAPAPAPAPKKQSAKPRRISMEGLQRAMSDLALELARDSSKKQQATPADADAAKQQQQLQLPAIAEQQQTEEEEEELARCECCGMQEECTPQYVRRVRDRYCGRWVCGLCAAAVSAEAESGRRATTEDALAAHMAVCGRFNRVGRANPVLLQTEAMREILRKRGRCDSPGVRERGARPAAAAAAAVLARSSSCIPAITKDFN